MQGVSSYANGSLVNVECNTNAKLIGSNTIECKNGTWLNSPYCNIYRCYEPSPISNAGIEVVAEYLINNFYNVTCDKGFDGSVTAFCESDGDWKVTGSCGIQNCSTAPEIYNSDNSYDTNATHSWKDTFTYRFVYY